MNDTEKYLIDCSKTILEAVRQLDRNDIETLIVKDDVAVVGIFTLGDFRRAVFNGLDINNSINDVVNHDFKYISGKYSDNDVRNLFLNNPMIVDLPVINNRNELIKVLHTRDYVDEKSLLNQFNRIKNIPLVIMAGGKGTRMDPFTRILPKPLVPIGNQPIIKTIMDEFSMYGVHDFYLTINHMGNMIRAYFHDHNLPYTINFIEEDKPLGTAGSLKYMKNNESDKLFISNCDMLMKTNLIALYDFHESHKFDMTIIVSLKHHEVPYGVCEIGKSGALHSIQEKPVFDYFVNTGMYIINKDLIQLIPEGEKFDMTDLISVAKKNLMRVGVYPVSENSWIDIGQWAEYKKSIKELSMYP